MSSAGIEKSRTKFCNIENSMGGLQVPSITHLTKNIETTHTASSQSGSAIRSTLKKVILNYR